MKLISPSIEIWEQTDFSLEGIKKHIEKCARVCYKSEDKITDDSYEKFVQMLIDRGHTAMLEHGTVCFELDKGESILCDKFIEKFENNPYSKVKNLYYDLDNPIERYCKSRITTNFRVTTDLKMSDDYRFLSEHYLELKRITVKLVCSRAVAQQLTRHRKFSFSMESQRYCNYNNDKFGNEITFVIPCWTDLPEGTMSLTPEKVWGILPTGLESSVTVPDKPGYLSLLESLARSEFEYINMIKEGLTPQQARAVLPNCTKTELVMTGFIEDWEYLFKLRCSDSNLGKPDPETSYLADKIREEFKNRNLIS